MENEHNEGINRDSAAASEPLPELLDLALDVLPDAAVVVDGAGHIVGVNDALTELFGHPQDALVGKPIELLIPERFRHAHRHHRGSFFGAPRQRAMGAGLQLAGRRRDATEFPVDISLAPVEVEGRTLVVAAVRDATERGALTAAIGQLAAIVSSSHDGILTMTTAGVVTTWNPAAEQLLGTPTEDAVGSHIGRWIPEVASEVLEELMGAIVTGGSPSSRDTAWLTADGKLIDVAISMSPMLNEQRGLGGFSILVRDVSERKAAEAIRDRQQRLQEATSEIRLASLSETPLDDILELICRRTLELTGGDGVAMVRERHGEVAVAAAWGNQLEAAVMELAGALLASEDPTASRLGLSLTERGGPYEVVGSLVPARSGGRGGALVVSLPSGREASGGVRTLIEGFAGQAALAIELSKARVARERLLLAEDRERIARDLHDLVIQRLFATGMTLQTLQQFTGDEVLADRLRKATDELDATIREIRTTIFDLEEAPGSAEGVRGQLLRLVTAATTSLGFHPSLQFEGPVDLVDEGVRHHVLAVTREALSNVARHAQASSVSVLVVAREGFTVVVEDDGIGLPERRDESGLANIRGRAADLGGELVLENRAEGGARMVWRVPTP